MRAWVDQVAELAGESHLWDRGFQFGDWLDPAAPADKPWAARTDHALVATAYHAHTARLLARAATVLGHSADEYRYRQLADQVVLAFDEEFVTPAGRLASDAPTAYALALRFELLRTRSQRARAARRLAQLVRRDGYRIGTGFVGTPLVCDALADAELVDEAYLLLLQERCPSWLYPVSMGATTVWERWDSMLPDGTINPGEMTSFNHYALGAVADFLQRVVAGLAPAEPGYRKLLVRPRPGGGLVEAAASLRTRYGEASIRWQRRDDRLSVDIGVPYGCTATVDLPGQEVATVSSGRHRLDVAHRPANQDPTEPAEISRFS
jgi:alpha-L-rhamnosidase